MPGYIPREQLDAYRRWQADSFDPPPPEPPPPEPMPDLEIDSEPVAGISLPTAEDIERIHNEAHAAGHEAGYEAGHEAGCHAGHEAGYQAGFEEGREAAYRAGLETAQAEAQRIATLAENFENALTALDQTVADQLLALALEVAGQVLRGTVSARPETLLPVIREAIAALPLHHGHVALHLHPDDAAVVRDHLGDQFAQSGWRIIEDREIRQGGCQLRAGSSEIDASLETRWKRVVGSIGADSSAWLEQ